MFYKKILFAILISLFFVINPVFAEENNILYSLTLGYDGNTLVKQNIQLIEGNVSSQILDVEQNLFTLQVLSFDKDVLYESQFIFSATPLFQPPREGDESSISDLEKNIQTSKAVLAPYFKNAKSIDIYKDDILRMSVNIAQFSTEFPEITSSPEYLQYPTDFPDDFYPQKKSKLPLLFVIALLLGGTVFVLHKKGIIKQIINKYKNR